MSSEEKHKSIKDAYHYYLKNPDHNQDKLLAVLNNYNSAWEKERKAHHDAVWRANLAFYSGNHSIRDNGANGHYRARLKENHTNNTIARMVSIFVQNMPIVRVFAASSSDEDVKNAENTEAYGKYFWRVKKFEQKLIKFVKYTTIFGNGFIYPSWNPDIGDRILMGSDDEGRLQEENQEKYYQGDIQVDIDDPFRIKARPGIDEMDDMYDIIRSVPANRFFLEQKVGELGADPVNSLNAFDNSVRIDSDIVLQHNYFHKPTPWFEEGLYVSWVGKKIVHVRPASKAEKNLPIIHLPFDKPPMRFYGNSSIEQVMDLQEQLNRAASMIIEARNLVARPRVLVSHEAKVPGQSLTDRPGEIIRYSTAGGLPKFEVPNFQFAEMQAHKADLRNALQAVMGITGASRGEIPPAIKTALGLQMVLEQDRSQYTPFIKNFYQSIQDMMGSVFSLAAENLDEEDPRVIKIEGSGTDRTFHGGMVPSPLDIYLEDTNPLGWTAAARTEQIVNLVDKQVVTDRNQVLEMLKLNNTDPAYKHLMLHKNAAHRENDELKKGIPLVIGSEDDDPIHLDAHTSPVATFEFRSWPKAVQDAFLMHIQEHKNRISPPPPPQGPQGGAPGPQPGGPPPHMPPHPMHGAPPPVHPMRIGGATPVQAGLSLQSPAQSQTMQGLLTK